MKNPIEGSKHPNAGGANNLPENMQIGRKVNIKGPANFALYPGQMEKVIKGHSLRSNQYLLARVYEADEANSNTGKTYDAEGKEIENTNTQYTNGQLLVIKGTEVSFYIPPTGIEVIPCDNNPQMDYVRNAVTLEKMEYCILKDEDGTKKYCHGPAVIFPEPTETFVKSPKGGVIFRAVELSKISGIYVKVITEYTDEQGVLHPAGEELFITGNDQMIYYSRPEHAIISYDGKTMHHAIAIPEGEGRYIMDRLTGKIKTVRGPAMYLPDSRTEVVVKRKLTESQCKLWYPGNAAVLDYNRALDERAVEKFVNKSIDPMSTAFYSLADCTTSTSCNLASWESNANVARGTSYTKPRTITLDNKLDGVVSLDIWTGYAVNIISKSGKREVVCGPQTVLLDYDQTLESFELSTGTPKVSNNPIKTVYLRHENNKVSDIISVETSDFVRAEVKVSYCVDFDKAVKDKWFNVDNYVKYLTDRMRSLFKKQVKEYTIQDFYQNYSTIIRSIALGDGEDNKRYFAENGMFIHDIEVLGLSVQSDIEDLFLEKQYEIINKTLELADAQRETELAEALSVAEKKQQELRTLKQMNEAAFKSEAIKHEANLEAQEKRLAEAEMQTRKQAEKDLQVLLDEISALEQARRTAQYKAEVERIKAKNDETIRFEQEKANIEAAKQKAYAETIKEIMGSISPDLIASLEMNGQCNLIAEMTKNMSPLSIANGESVVDTTDRLLRGMPIDLSIKDIIKQ